jgi:hypothetical protein
MLSDLCRYLVDAPPHAGWLVVCLCRFRARQEWASSLKDLLVEPSGKVPGQSGWTYEYDWEDDCVVLCKDGEVSIVLHDGWEPARVDPIGLACAVMASTTGPEVLLQGWLGHRWLYQSAVEMLVPLGLLDVELSVTPALEQIYDAIVKVDFHDPDVFKEWRQSLECSEERYREWLLSLAEGMPDSYLLEALATGLQEADLVPICERVLQGDVGSNCGTALEILDRQQTSRIDVVRRYWKRLHPEKHHPYSAWASAQYLLRRGESVESVLEQAAGFADRRIVEGYRGNPYDDNWALLWLEFDPANALPRVRRALRSSTPMCATNMAAVMACLDQSWCHRELRLALEEGPPAGVSENYLRQGGMGHFGLARIFVALSERSFLESGFRETSWIGELFCLLQCLRI